MSRANIAIPSNAVHDFGAERRPYALTRYEKCPIPWETGHFTQDIEIDDTGTAVYFSLC